MSKKQFRSDVDLISHMLVGYEGVARKLLGNALPISARVGKVDLAVNLGYIARLIP